MTLLGQNVNSYNHIPTPDSDKKAKKQYAETKEAKSRGFQNIAKPLASEDGVDFTQLMRMVSMVKVSCFKLVSDWY